MLSNSEIKIQQITNLKENTSNDIDYNHRHKSFDNVSTQSNKLLSMHLEDTNLEINH